MRWQGANEATVSMQIVELRLGTRVYFVMWHWWGQHEYCWEISNNCPYLHTQAAISCSSVAHHILFSCITSFGQSLQAVSGAGECCECWAAKHCCACCPVPLPLLLLTGYQIYLVPHANSTLNPITFFILIKKHASIYLTSEAWCMAESFWTFGQA